MSLPTGTVTFVFTDIEGSTALLKRLGDAPYADLLAIHRRLVRDIFAGHEGHEIDTQGDAFFYTFTRARQAVRACVELQRAHAKASWPGEASVRVRIGLHTGEPAVGDEGYTGLDVVRASRIAEVGNGGQILVSSSTRAIVGADLPEGVRVVPLGERRLKDIDGPESIFALVEERDAAAAAPDHETTGSGASAPEFDDLDPDRPTARPSVMRQLITDARQRLEERVLAQLESSLGAEGFPFGTGRPSEPPPPPRATRSRSLTREIARLKELHDAGALTEEQYRRAVDQLLDDFGPDGPE